MYVSFEDILVSFSLQRLNFLFDHSAMFICWISPKKFRIVFLKDYLLSEEIAPKYNHYYYYYYANSVLVESMQSAQSQFSNLKHCIRFPFLQITHTNHLYNVDRLEEPFIPTTKFLFVLFLDASFIITLLTETASSNTSELTMP